MRLTDQQLIGLPVLTTAGHPIGKVVGFELDTEHQVLYAYYVSAAPLVTKLVGRSVATLHIATSQVVSLDAEQMVVVDNAVHSVAPNTAAI